MKFSKETSHTQMEFVKQQKKRHTSHCNPSPQECLAIGKNLAR